MTSIFQVPASPRGLRIRTNVRFDGAVSPKPKSKVFNDENVGVLPAKGILNSVEKRKRHAARVREIELLQRLTETERKVSQLRTTTINNLVASTRSKTQAYTSKAD